MGHEHHYYHHHYHNHHPGHLVILQGEGGEEKGEAGHEAPEDRSETNGAAAAIGDREGRHQQ